MLTASAVKDFCLLHSMSCPEQILWTDGYLKNSTIAEAMFSDPVPEIPFAVICEMCYTEAIRNISDKREVLRPVLQCLRAIVRMERTQLPAMFSPECFTTREILLFDGFAYYGEVEYARVRIFRDNRAGTWWNLFRDIAAMLYCTIYWYRDNIPCMEAILLTDA